jgi:hypothetical protein
MTQAKPHMSPPHTVKSRLVVTAYRVSPRTREAVRKAAWMTRSP